MRWLFFFSRKPAREAKFDAELRYHLDRLIDEKVAAGVNREQAKREAAIEFGGREQLKEELRDVHRLALLKTIAANIKSGFRLIRRSPTFAIAVILTLALGIGANSAVFSALDAILLRPLAFPHGEELMLMLQTDRRAKNPKSFVAPVRLEDWNRLAQTFQSISGWYTQDASESSGTLPEKVTEALTAPRFLQTWGTAPALGRDFSPDEEHFGGPNAVLISDRFWRRRFRADPAVVGKRLRLEKSSYTIVGVMPASFLFPDHDVEVWCPNPADAPYAQSREATWFYVFGRLKPGVTVSQARADLNNLQSRLGRRFPKTDSKLGVDIQPLKENTVGGVRRSLWVLFGSVSLLLLIACTNIAALLLARTAEREREIAILISQGLSNSDISRSVARLRDRSALNGVPGAGIWRRNFRTLRGCCLC